MHTRQTDILRWKYSITIYKETKVPEHTQRNICKGPDQRPGAKQPRRCWKLKVRTICQLICFISSTFKNRTTLWQELADSFTDRAHASTVKKELNRHRYHKYKACQKSWIWDENVKHRAIFAKLWKNILT